tara:strand:- start:45 stop:335 length:291 start_codon:yes stop_codon:yes gene_type:complete
MLNENQFNFTFENIHKQYASAIDAGYHFVTCSEYCTLKAQGNLPSKLIVNRVDIDLSVKKAEPLFEIFNQLEIRAAFFCGYTRRNITLFHLRTTGY